ncbi:phosphatidate phosphatase PAH1-like isoform X3 [Asparagus officinalis]|uniref:phosphatidate phosphatase PAH1-like isoform X3 n=1 Tax=Asparagus officinalis TaxID=4686 RepID=UPI00098E568D|nr:phosphatidate phosphatase PAH1-like isoform X3 [Asparagus officinalis]
MNVVGKVGSLISQGVYSFATPFHPFGGAVDIIVVEQEDGTYRSTPWYVRFGKFQGIIKGAEKLVTISVNGVDADFHMYLDHSGQAYFMREVEGSDSLSSSLASVEGSPHKSSQDDTTCNNAQVRESVYEEHREGEGNDENSYMFPEAHSSPARSSCSPGFSPYSYGNLEDVEEIVKSSNDSSSEMVLISVDGHVLTAPISSNEEESADFVQSTNPQFHLGPGESSGEEFGAIFGDLDTSSLNDTNTSEHPSEGPKDAKEDSICMDEAHANAHLEISNGENTSVGASASLEEVCKISHGEMDTSPKDIDVLRSDSDRFKSCLDLVSHAHEGDLHEMCSGPEGNLKHSSEVSSFSETMLQENAARDNWRCKSDALQCVHTRVEFSEKSMSADLNQEDVMMPSGMSVNPDIHSSEKSPAAENVNDSSAKDLTNENMIQANSSNSVGASIELTSGRSDVEGESNDLRGESSMSGLGFELSLCGNLLFPGMGRTSAEEVFEAHRISEEEFKACGPSIIKNGNLIVRYKESYFPWDRAAYIVLGKATFGSDFFDVPHDSIPVEHVGTTNGKEDGAYANSPSSRRWRLWPISFRRASSLNSNNSSEEFFVDSECALQSPHIEQNSNINSPSKQLLRTNIPTTEQIASLNLEDGQNVIAFRFFSRVLGKQEVDAHIYLWKWNARIVISDVDGTITKSDVLGQVMPLVGKDWTQSGVAGLFSAIKDGKALPSGPVVISPDGLFPSLFREVIRRAPHEFKIACLEDIKALFPSDYNPFYAGFGNRDTDELSYRKIGIPKGKIFIINPKGEVAINHCVGVKSYTNLHTLVNDMFPPTSMVEQEDFNAWNYWKMPLPDID